MPTNPSVKGDVAIEYIRRYPKLPKRTIARIMHAEHPTMFTSIDNARTIVKDYSGANGIARRNGKLRVKKMAERNITRPLGMSGEDPWKDMMPSTKMSVPKEFVIPSSIKKMLVLSDIHIPYHHPEALGMAIKYGIDNDVDCVLLNGDTMDFYAASFHEKDPRKVDWMGEIEAGREFIKMIRAAFPKAAIYWKDGNHEKRLERHLMQNSQILLGMPEFELPWLLKMEESKIIHIANKTNIKAGKLNIIHGDEYRGSGGVNPARWLSLRTGEPTICGHFHRTSNHMDKTIRHDIRGWWSTGCLCELSPDYMPYSQWNLGFAIVNINNDGTFEVDNKIIVNGKVR